HRTALLLLLTEHVYERRLHEGTGLTCSSVRGEVKDVEMPHPVTRDKTISNELCDEKE
ncbi:uncharacterized, partial [Tachysurus ichikawai]